MFKKFETHIGNQRFVLEEDLPEVGWYIYIFDKNGNCVGDHLQDDYAMATTFALEEYKIEEDKWRLVND